MGCPSVVCNYSWWKINATDRTERGWKFRNRPRCRKRGRWGTGRVGRGHEARTETLLWLDSGNINLGLSTSNGGRNRQLSNQFLHGRLSRPALQLGLRLRHLLLRPNPDLLSHLGSLRSIPITLEMADLPRIPRHGVRGWRLRLLYWYGQRYVVILVILVSMPVCNSRYCIRNSMNKYLK